jgi:hypothetical protein
MTREKETTKEQRKVENKVKTYSIEQRRIAKRVEKKQRIKKMAKKIENRTKTDEK